MKRRKLTRKGSQAMFKKATGVHKKNFVPARIMRGGYRL
jgi:hypothetical protein